MILDFTDLKDHQGQVAMVDGAFDPLHHGHIEYFRRARELGVPLLCNIAPDSYVSAKHAPLLEASRRALVIDALASVDYTHVSRSDTETVLRELRPTRYIKGRDWEGRLPPEQERICAAQGTEIVLLDTVLDSSTELLHRYTGPRSNGDGDVSVFERLVNEQRAVEAGHYDAEYFVSDWRDGENDYTIEARRKIEGRHPEVIQEVFRPARVLDVGCGPGVLLFLLQEQGLLADGVDFSSSCRTLAPPEVRDRIRIGTTADPTLFADDTYDLVICREVMEHLTVLQVRETVRNLCRISSRYVYVTTRFHPDPAGLLDVTTQFEVDPSHITLLNKDFLRVLFVLEGFRRREDLESAIDWLGKGRVLVYEQPGGGGVSEPVGTGGVDAVLGYHLNPLTCGVAKFNLLLARRLQVPMLGLFDGRVATLRHPLLSLKLSEFTETDTAALASIVETASWRRRFMLFLHAWSDTPVEQVLLSRAATVFCGNAELVAVLRARRADIQESWCPSTLLEPQRFNPRGLSVFAFGMAHKVRSELHRTVQTLLERTGQPYSVYPRPRSTKGPRLTSGSQLCSTSYGRSMASTSIFSATCRTPPSTTTWSTPRSLRPFSTVAYGQTTPRSTPRWSAGRWSSPISMNIRPTCSATCTI